MLKKSSGFTLMELVIAVAVIGILTVIAYPNYQRSIQKARRADAKSVLLQASQWMERFYTINNRYDQNLSGTVVTDSTLFLSSGLTKAPISGSTKYYSISVTAPSKTTFTISAVPISGTPQATDACKTLTLDQIGTRGTSSTTMTADDCWR
ncbi:type IV pilus assembly protein PilE [Gammaproteobacteria bacterium]